MEETNEPPTSATDKEEVEVEIIEDSAAIVEKQITQLQAQVFNLLHVHIF